MDPMSSGVRAGRDPGPGTPGPGPRDLDPGTYTRRGPWFGGDPDTAGTWIRRGPGLGGAWPGGDLSGPVGDLDLARTQARRHPRSLHSF